MHSMTAYQIQRGWIIAPVIKHGQSYNLQYNAKYAFICMDLLKCKMSTARMIAYCSVCLTLLQTCGRCQTFDTIGGSVPLLPL